jgi:pyruvate dehydrogenase E2 component (dihydrolipoamide acetyltransferase)
MPTLGLTMEQGTIARWLKQEGDTVERDEPLFTVETDKATMDVPAPAAGVLARVLAPNGATVPVQETIAIIAAPGEAVPDQAGNSDRASPAAVPAEPPSVERPAAAAQAPGEDAVSPLPDSGRGLTPVADHAVLEASRRVGKLEHPVSPRARRVAAELGVDPAEVQGTGPGGRVVEADVRRHAAGRRQAPQARASPLAQRLALELGVDLAAVKGSGPGGRIRREDVEAAQVTAAAQPPVQPSAAAVPAVPPGVAPPAAVAQPSAAAAGGRLATLNRLRRITAERMAQSARTVARVTLFVEIDFAEALRLRAQLLPEFERRYGARLTYDTLVARACALALVEHPALNAHWTDEGPRLFEQVDVGVAIALPDGLVVPVVRDVARRPLWDVARSVNDVVARAQEGRLGPQDYGGTFTITNLGLYGVEGFTPIVNPPEVAILGVGAVQTKPVVADGAVAVGQRLTLSLAFDHRAVDGAPAAAFLARVREALEKPYILLT